MEMVPDSSASNWSKMTSGTRSSWGGDNIFGMMESNLKRLAPNFFRLVITCYNPTYLSCGVRLSWWLQTWNKINKPPLFGVVSLTQPIISDEIDVGVIPESPRLAQSSCDPSCLVPWWRFAEVHSSIHPFFIHSSSILHPFFIHSSSILHPFNAFNAVNQTKMPNSS